MGKADFKFHTKVRVRWGECDRQGIVYYGAYLDYLETAQGAYFRNLGFSLYKLAETGHFDTATVKVTIEYKAPARVEDLLDVYFRVASFGSTSYDGSHGNIRTRNGNAADLRGGGVRRV